MKDLEKKLDLFVSKVQDEYNNKIPEGGIINTLIAPKFEDEYKPDYDLKTLISAIVNNKSVAKSEFEKYFLKTNLRFKVLYDNIDVTTSKMKDQIPSLLNIIDENVYISIERIKKNIFKSIEEAEITKKTKANNKHIQQNTLIKLNSGKYFDSSFNGTNPTTNVRPILDELVKLDPKPQYKKIPTKGFNNEMINAYL